MKQALELAKESALAGETPVGCVIVDKTGEVIGSGRNRRERCGHALAHAEMEAIWNACRVMGDWRLTDCNMYVTLEPCPMCAGAVIMSRISGLYYGAREPNTGSCGSVINLFMEGYGQKTKIYGGVLADECSAMMREFFREIRGG